ncbi:hypothetical protein CAOG_00275 [Capsaspora owczarzaki ATCC 30864]|uniref:Uncharacterized protein n=1 Tax=Capsaspora owczarzaki (strain ATCC 30864) TaxID=595528 RepID=A0A0D2WIA1_CAPO3|nr:hypothetical protein CAOG_00275 [Capsaspora owczarzaki ATCC 30864]KJE88667.1 hypothetical protein CAOG_000275 [Capsaspora owczarzaki ATCC 30864]KJE88668.1 hypothetical protein, variant [Capsaspora owczarzaki ATCC 30864]|eukprot:XP_004365146.2 hypothetical protein CAOG_00275 [Capsaspora owczarzaki ATCC 30864]
MNSGAPRSVAPRIRVSYTIRPEGDPRHRFGVNALCLSTAPQNVELPSSSANQTLYTAGRDGVVRAWDVTQPVDSLASTRTVETCIQSFDGHADWVNDIALCPNHQLLTASSDTSVKLWSCDGELLTPLDWHSDYVKALAVSHTSHHAFSAGLDRLIVKWDLNVAKPSEILSTAVELKGHKDSVYSLAVDHSGSILVSGSTEKIIRVWDARTPASVCKLRGHTDNIKAVALNHDGSLCLSASSDHTIRLWDIRQQRCIATSDCHTSAIWTVAVNADFTKVYSAGRDGSVFVTSLDTFKSEPVLTEQAPVLRLCLDESDHADTKLWVATTDSTVRLWSVAAASTHGTSRASADSSATTAPPPAAPLVTIPGAPAIVKHHILNDRQRILTEDTAGNVVLWSVLQARMEKEFGQVGFDTQLAALHQMISLQSWFSVDSKCGFLTIHLDSSQCFITEVYASDIGLDADPEVRVGLAQLVLTRLFANWLISFNAKKGLSNALEADSTPPPLGEPHSPLLENQGPQFASEQSNGVASSPAADLPSPSAASVKPRDGIVGRLQRMASSSSQTTTPSVEIPSAAVKESQTGESELDRHELEIPDYTTVMLMDMSKAATSSGFPLFRSTCRAMADAWVADALASKMPQWLYDFLTTNTCKRELGRDKMSLAVQPHPQQLPGEPPLPVLPDPAYAKLYAFRILRVRRLAKFVADKLGISIPDGFAPEEVIELTCDNKAIDPNMSIATVKQFVWCQPEDLVLHYRRCPRRS